MKTANLARRRHDTLNWAAGLAGRVIWSESILDLRIAVAARSGSRRDANRAMAARRVLDGLREEFEAALGALGPLGLDGLAVDLDREVDRRVGLARTAHFRALVILVHPAIGAAEVGVWS